MTKQKAVEKIEQMICDKNYCINSQKGTEEQIYAWKYAREDLLNVLKIVKAINEMDFI